MAKTNPQSTVNKWLFPIFWVILPLVWVESLIDDSLVPRQLFTAIFLIVVVAVNYKTLFASHKMSLAGLSLIGFLIVTAIASLNAINPVESMATLSRYGLMLAYFATTVSLLQSGRLHVHSLVQAVIAFGGIAAVITLLHILRLLGEVNILENIYAVKGTFSHKNLLSSALMMCLPFTIAGYALFNSRWKTISLVLLFLITAEIFLLRTRGVWLSTVAGSVAGMAVFFSFRRKAADRPLELPVKLVSAALILAVLIVGILFSIGSVRGKITEQSNLDKRFVFWENSMGMINDNPALGVGAGNWKIHFPKYGLVKLDNNVKQGITAIQRPHNDYLWVWTEGGPLALIFYLGIFLLTIWRSVKNLQHPANREGMVLDMAIISGVIAYMAFSLTDFPLERMPHNLLVLTLAALAHRDFVHRGLNVPAGVLKVLVLALAIFGLLVNYYRFQGEKGAVKILEANARQDARSIIASVEQTENDYFNMDNFANPLRYYSAMGKLVQKQVQPSWQDMQRAHDVHPYHILTLNLMGNNFLARNEPDKALGYFNQALEISPTFVQPLLSKADIYLKRRNYAEAMRALAHVRYSNNHPRYLQLLANVLPALEQTRNSHGRYQPLLDFIRSKRPRSREDYIRLYRDYRRENG